MDYKRAMERAKALVAQMTLEEKASQLSYDAAAVKRLGIPFYNWWNEALHGVARAGTATVFPQAIGLAAAFDRAGIQAMADVIATEGRAKHNAARAHNDRAIYKGLTFWSPNINIFRDPRWGRGQETYGEDPYLTAETGIAFVRGLQGDPDDPYLKSAACAKHLAVHSGPESERHHFDVTCSKKDLRETYLYAFERLVKEAKVEAVMGAYNRFNGVPCCANTELLHILRDEWGFEGHFVSDCGAIADFHNFHHVTSTAPESAAMALKAGCDLNCGNTYMHMLVAYQEGLVTEEEITRSCERLMATRFRLGLFDDDCPYDAIDISENDTDAHDAMALELAQKSMVLLRNDGILPLDPKALKTIAVIGPNADSVDALQGNYYGTSSRYVRFIDGIRRECEKNGIRLLYSIGSHLYNDHVGNCAAKDDLLSEAETYAECADVVLLFVGLDPTIEGEQGDQFNDYSTGDKRDLDLPKSQQRLVERLRKTGKRVVTVLSSGSALSVDFGNAILQTWYPGQAGGTALADILFGRVSPSGKLPVTFYRSADDLPPFEDYSMERRTYRYFDGEPLYPFGYGLSYTRFAYEDIAFDGESIEVTISNIGDVAGDAVAQVYVKAEDCAFSPRNASLCGFQRVRLMPNECRRIRIPVSKDAFTAVDPEGHRVPAGRAFTLYVGGSQPDARSQELTGETVKSIRVEL